MLDQIILQQLMDPFGLSAERAEFISQSQNYVYRVLNECEQVIVRISVGRHRTKSQIEAELLWIKNLVCQGIRVSSSIPALDGNLCSEIVVDNVLYLVSCFEHAPGNLLKRDESNEVHFAQLGSLAGSLHSSVSVDEAVNSIDRPQWDKSRLLNEDFSNYSDNIPENFTEGVIRLMADLKSIPKDEHSFGLIHGDLSFGNFYKDGKNIWLIDFDNCEYGFFLQDLAVFLYDSIYYKALIEFSDFDLSETMNRYWVPFLQGYFSTSPLKRVEIAVIKKFFLLREAVLYVHYQRVFTKEQMTESFQKGQNQKIQNILNLTHEVNFEVLFKGVEEAQ